MPAPIRRIEYQGHKVLLIARAYNKCPWTTHYDIEIDGQIHRFAEDELEHYHQSPRTLAEGRKAAKTLIDTGWPI
jgi:hypothetical protein